MIRLASGSQIIKRDELLTVFRDGAVKFDDGKLLRETPEEFKVKGTVQPVDGRDLLLVPEGDRFKEQYWLWTDLEIRVNDRVARCGVNFQVQNVESWGSFFQSRITRIDTGPEATP